MQKNTPAFALKPGCLNLTPPSGCGDANFLEVDEEVGSSRKLALHNGFMKGVRWRQTGVSTVPPKNGERYVAVYYDVVFLRFERADDYCRWVELRPATRMILSGSGLEPGLSSGDE
ncbi:hypothetical protein [Prosthecobacter sp.]|uniref:hypothetical protein n=1 Tax=Prosthecobacter sp. TaxID=1965333 RepID=UPI00378463F2